MRDSLPSDLASADRQSLWNSVFAQAGWGIVIGSKDGRTIELVNRAFAEMHGYTEGELAGQPVEMVFAPNARADIASQIARVHERGRYVFESLHCRRDGSTFPVRINATAVRNQRGEVEYRVVSVEDISDRKVVEQALLRTQQQLRALSAHHEAVLENERRKIAREVHDELGQLLTALNMDISLLDIRFGAHPDIRKAALEMHALVERTIAVVRHVASNLRPAALDLGLVAAVEWLAEDFRLRWEIPCVVRLDRVGENMVLDDNLSTAAFRIVQESLTNIARHAQARHVFVSLLLQDNMLMLSVADDGRGFDIQASPTRPGFGLLSIRERVLALGGELMVNSQPGCGTSLHIKLPLKSSTAT